MNLHARAVELVLQRRFAEARHRVFDAFRRLGQHRLQRPEQLQREVGEPDGTGVQGLGGHGSEIAAQHDEGVQRLQDWIKLPSIAGMDLGYPEGPEHMARLLKESRKPCPWKASVSTVTGTPPYSASSDSSFQL